MLLAGLVAGCIVLAGSILSAVGLSLFNLISIKAALSALPIGIIGGGAVGAVVARMIGRSFAP
jgi:hypothetical protein